MFPTLNKGCCLQGHSDSKECPRVSALANGRVQLILPARMVCVMFAHQSKVKICCELHWSSSQEVQHHHYRIKHYLKLLSLQMGQPFSSGPGLHTCMNSTRELLWTNTGSAKKPQHSMEIHDETIQPTVGHETTWVVLAPVAKAAAHQFHETSCRSLQYMCHSTQELSTGNFTLHCSQPCSAQWLIKQEKIIGLSRA